MQRIDRTAHGQVNELVAQRIRGWLAAAGQASLDRLRAAKGVAVADSSTLMSNLALLLDDIGSHEGGSSSNETEARLRAALAALTTKLEKFTQVRGSRQQHPIAAICPASQKLRLVLCRAWQMRVAGRTPGRRSATKRRRTSFGVCGSSWQSVAPTWCGGPGHLPLMPGHLPGHLPLMPTAEECPVFASLTTQASRVGPEESLSLNMRAYGLTEAVVCEHLNETGGIDALVFAQHATTVNNLGEAHYGMAMLQAHPSGGDHFLAAQMLFQKSMAYSANIFGAEAAEAQGPRHNLAALLIALPPVKDCPDSHGLARIVCPPQRACDMCQQDLESGVTILSCDVCGYDCCIQCS